MGLEKWYIPMIKNNDDRADGDDDNDDDYDDEDNKLKYKMDTACQMS